MEKGNEFDRWKLSLFSWTIVKHLGVSKTGQDSFLLSEKKENIRQRMKRPSHRRPWITNWNEITNVSLHWNNRVLVSQREWRDISQLGCVALATSLLQISRENYPIVSTETRPPRISSLGYIIGFLFYVFIRGFSRQTKMSAGEPRTAPPRDTDHRATWRYAIPQMLTLNCLRVSCL